MVGSPFRTAPLRIGSSLFAQLCGAMLDKIVARGYRNSQKSGENLLVLREFSGFVALRRTFNGKSTLLVVAIVLGAHLDSQMIQLLPSLASE
ncbi:protein of unknown function [Burkholderia multivorans]